MKKYFKNFSICLTIILTIFLCFGFVSTNADVGDYESYDNSWDSDWDSDWDINWDSDSSYDWSSDWDSDFDSDLAGDLINDIAFLSIYGGESSSSTLIIIIIILVILYHKTKQGKITTSRRNYDYTPKINYHQRESKINSDCESESSVAAKIRANDKLFNKEEFVAWSKDIFIKLQEAWTKRDWETIRPFETSELFEQHQKQLNGYIERKQINMLERICVLNAKLSRYEASGDKEILTVTMNTRMNDYIIDETTKQIVKGTKDKDIYGTYKLVFIRKLGIKTQSATSEIKTTNCPNCGAPTQITSTGKCEYCGSVIKTGDFNWVLSNLERIKK